MKFLYFIFALYTLSLALIPCSDVRDCDDTGQHDLVNQHQEEHEEETCAPFCICACCGTITSLAQPVQFTLIAVTFSNPVPSFISGQPLEVSPSIWQPPPLV